MWLGIRGSTLVRQGRLLRNVLMDILPPFLMKNTSTTLPFPPMHGSWRGRVNPTPSLGQWSPRPGHTQQGANAVICALLKKPPSLWTYRTQLSSTDDLSSRQNVGIAGNGYSAPSGDRTRPLPIQWIKTLWLNLIVAPPDFLKKSTNIFDMKISGMMQQLNNP